MVSCHSIHLGPIPPGDGAARERDLVDLRVPDEMLADLTPGGHDVDDALGHPGGHDRVGQQDRVERRLRRGLDDDRRARGERRRELQHRDEERHVPWHACSRRRRPARAARGRILSMPGRTSSNAYSRVSRT